MLSRVYTFKMYAYAPFYYRPASKATSGLVYTDPHLSINLKFAVRSIKPIGANEITKDINL